MTVAVMTATPQSDLTAMIVETVAIVVTAGETEEIVETVEIAGTVVAKAQVQVAKQVVTGVEIGSARNATPTTLLDELSASSVARRSLKGAVQAGSQGVAQPRWLRAGDVADKLRTLPSPAPLSSEDSCWRVCRQVGSQ